MKNIQDYEKYIKNSELSEREKRIATIGVIIAEYTTNGVQKIRDKDYDYLLKIGSNYIEELSYLKIAMKFVWSFNWSKGYSWSDVCHKLTVFDFYFNLRPTDNPYKCIQNVLDYIEEINDEFYRE